MKLPSKVLSVLLTLVLTGIAFADNGTRTDINPALLYWQATAIMPDHAAQDHLFTNEWRGRALDEQFEKQIATYDNAFKLLRQAARQKAPCDWGYDLSQGPELLLPGLAKAKQLSQAARLRMRWHLQHGRPDDARDDLFAAFVLGRQVATDGILLSALVQIAMENILASGIAENWFRFSPQTLQQVMDSIAAAPARGAIVRCVASERRVFKNWLARKLGEFQAASGGESEALQKTRQLLRSLLSGGDAPEEPASPTPESIIQSAGGTTAGLLRLLNELDPLYDEAAVLMTVPYGQFQPQIKAFNEKVANHPNLFVHVFFPAFEKCRLKEFAIEVKLAMLRAAHAHRLSGKAGLGQVPDPLFHEPFQFRRFEFLGADRGFELRSKMDARGWSETVIFIEKDGPAFHIDGKPSGQPVN